MPKTTYIEKDECTSCALCTDGLPQYYKMDDDDLAFAYTDGSDTEEASVKDEDIDKVQEMMDECPAECIHWK